MRFDRFVYNQILHPTAFLNGTYPLQQFRASPTLSLIQLTSLSIWPSLLPWEVKVFIFVSQTAFVLDGSPKSPAFICAGYTSFLEIFVIDSRLKTTIQGLISFALYSRGWYCRDGSSLSHSLTRLPI